VEIVAVMPENSEDCIITVCSRT